MYYNCHSANPELFPSFSYLSYYWQFLEYLDSTVSARNFGLPDTEGNSNYSSKPSA